MDDRVLELMDMVKSQQPMRETGKNAYPTPVPATVSAALPGLKVNDYYNPTENIGGYIFSNDPQNMWINTKNNLKTRAGTLFHEADHLLAMRGTGSGHGTNQEYDRLAKESRLINRGDLVKRLSDQEGYLEKFYGMKSGYFSPDMLAFQGPRAHNLLAEMLAVLSSIQQQHRTGITDDPYLQKHVFDKPELREAVDSLMGLRQTRLDARDLQPYTPISKQPKSRQGYR